MVYLKGTKQPIPRDTEVSERDQRAITRACREAVPPALRGVRRVDWSLRALTVRLYVRRPLDPADLDGEWTSRRVARLTYQPSEAAWTTTYARGGRYREAPEAMGSLALVLRRTFEDQAGLIAEG